MAPLSHIIFIALSLSVGFSTVKAEDEDWYKTAVDEMEKGPPEAIYTRGDALLFLGIPYAGHSNGTYAFEKPQKMGLSKEFTNQINLDFGPYCAQMWEMPGLISSFLVGQQDCLTLNVIQPRPPNFAFKATRRYPVYVVLHGGGLISGTARDFGIQGIVHNLVARGIVVVTVEYRLGPFGLFNFGDGGEGSSLRSLRDVMAALRWVQTYIGDFAGDNKTVTLGGWDGGACLVTWLTLAASNKSNGISDLFHQADIHSGGGDLCFQLQWSLVAKNASRQIAEQLCPANTNFKNPIALRMCMNGACICVTKDNATVCEERTRKCAEAAQNLAFYTVASSLLFPVGQMEPPDGPLFPLGPYALYLQLNGLKGKPALKVEERNPIRIMLSGTRDEWATIRMGETVERYDKAYLRYQFSRLTSLNMSEPNATATFNAFIDAYKGFYKLNETLMDEKEWYKLYVMFFTHYLFSTSMLLEASTYRDVGQQLLMYEFAHDQGPFTLDANAAKFGLNVAGHGSDVPYVFMAEQYFKAGPHNPLAPGNDDLVLREEWRLADVMGHLIVDFIQRRPTGLRIGEAATPYWMTPISRQAGFAPPVHAPPYSDILHLMYDEKHCNFGAQYGDPPLAKDVSRCVKNKK